MLQRNLVLYALNLIYTRDSPQSTESDGNSGGLMGQHIFAPLPISKVAAEEVEIALLNSLKYST